MLEFLFNGDHKNMFFHANVNQKSNVSDIHTFKGLYRGDEICLKF